MSRIYVFLTLALSIWMLSDAIRRRVHWSWYVVIILFYPLGGMIYLFFVYLPSRQSAGRSVGGGSSGGLLGGPNIRRLREQVEQLRSVDHLLQLAEALLERQEVEEAAQLAEEAYRSDPDHKRAAFDLGAARLATGDFEGAERVLGALIALEPSYRDHEARFFLAEVRWRAGRRQDALVTARKIARLTERLPHRALYARYLHEMGELREARLELEDALAQHAAAPSHVRRLNRDAAREANYRLTDLRKTDP